jgi:RNA polymerase sigma factor for flagellar operon FliA
MIPQPARGQPSPSASAIDKSFATKDPAEIRPLVAGTGPLLSATVLDVERERLILAHLPQVRTIARRIHARLPESVNLDDLISVGTIGLIAAIDRFDPSHNVQLKTYAEYKIRGAMLDSLRKLDWAPRQQRRRSKQVEAAISEVEQRLHRAPSADEIARQLELSLEEYHKWLLDIRGVKLGNLDASAPDDDSLNLLKYLSDDQESWPSRLLERSEEQGLLAAAVNKMPRIERIVINLYYHEELTLREIAKVLNLHESRVSQLRSRAILLLRSNLEQQVHDGEFRRYLVDKGPTVPEDICVKHQRLAGK